MDRPAYSFAADSYAKEKEAAKVGTWIGSLFFGALMLWGLSAGYRYADTYQQRAGLESLQRARQKGQQEAALAQQEALLDQVCESRCDQHGTGKPREFTNGPTLYLACMCGDGYVSPAEISPR